MDNFKTYTFKGLNIYSNFDQKDNDGELNYKVGKYLGLLESDHDLVSLTFNHNENIFEVNYQFKDNELCFQLNKLN